MVCLKSTMIPFTEKFVATITLLLQPARSRRKPFPAKRLGGIPPAAHARRQTSRRHLRRQGGRRPDSCREDADSGDGRLGSLPSPVRALGTAGRSPRHGEGVKRDGSLASRTPPLLPPLSFPKLTPCLNTTPKQRLKTSDRSWVYSAVTAAAIFAGSSPSPHSCQSAPRRSTVSCFRLG